MKFDEANSKFGNFEIHVSFVFNGSKWNAWYIKKVFQLSFHLITLLWYSVNWITAKLDFIEKKFIFHMNIFWNLQLWKKKTESILLKYWCLIIITGKAVLYWLLLNIYFKFFWKFDFQNLEMEQILFIMNQKYLYWL